MTARDCAIEGFKRCGFTQPQIDKIIQSDPDSFSVRPLDHPERAEEHIQRFVEVINKHANRKN